MTEQKDFKRLVRDRMGRTGERYTVAKSRVGSKRSNAVAGEEPLIRRVFGLRTPYSVTADVEGLAPTSDVAVQYLFHRTVSRGRPSNVFLENGARLYQAGEEPTYATSECDTLGDLVAQDRAGERIFDELARFAGRRWQQERGVPASFTVRKGGEVAGDVVQENYLIDRGVDLERYRRVMLPFLVTRQLLAGTGARPMPLSPSGFLLSPAALSLATRVTSTAALVGVAADAHADKERWRRLQVRIGEANMSEAATFLKVGSTALVLGLAEIDEAALPDLTLEDPLRTLAEISLAPSRRSPVRLADGRRVLPEDMQREYLKAARRMVERRGATDEDYQVLALWEDGLVHLEADRDSPPTWCDWALKWSWIAGADPGPAGELSEGDLAVMDAAYHNVDPRHGLYLRTEAEGAVRRVSDEGLIEEAVKRPPQTTRARLRGEFIKRAKQRRRDYTVGWTHLGLRDHAQRTVSCRNPFASEDDRVQRLLDSMGSGT